MIFFQLKNTSFFIISIALITTTVFGFSYLLLNNFSESLIDQINKEIAQQKEEKLISIEEATKELNTQLKSAQQIQNDYIQWTTFLSDFSGKVIDGITLTNVEFITSTKSFKLMGMADTRATLLEFQDELEKLPTFNEITSPVSNLSQPENIQFEITGLLTDEVYKKN